MCLVVGVLQGARFQTRKKNYFEKSPKDLTLLRAEELFTISKVHLSPIVVCENF